MTSMLANSRGEHFVDVWRARQLLHLVVLA
jgi:hypothetical protein